MKQVKAFVDGDALQHELRDDGSAGRRSGQLPSSTYGTAQPW